MARNIGAFAILVLIIIFCFSPRAYSASEENSPKKITVMNFDNRSSTGEWQWLSKGFADMIITDLSASERLTVVERERLNEIVAELQLVKTGVVDSSIANRVGQMAKVDWVLFGSFLKEGNHLKIEAHILDLKTQKLMRVEWVEGLAEEVLHLEKRLVQQLLERLDIPITEEEKRSIMYVPTDSVPALEHYCKSLDLYDNGQWFDALLECRLAVRQDTDFMKPRGRVAELYYEIGKPEHAFVEYHSLVVADKDSILPERFYYKMGMLLDSRFVNPDTLLIYEKILSRCSELDTMFDGSGNPLKSPPYMKMPARTIRYILRVMERVAANREVRDDTLEMAKRYWQMKTLISQNKLGSMGGLKKKVFDKYYSLYWQLFRDNRDTLFPPPPDYLLVPKEGGVFEAELLAEYCNNSSHSDTYRFVASPDMEIARISVTVSGKDSVRFRLEPGGRPWHPNPAMAGQPQYIKSGSTATCKPKLGVRKAYIVMYLDNIVYPPPNDPGGQRNVQYELAQRRAQKSMYVKNNITPTIQVDLRPWSGTKEKSKKIPKYGRLDLTYYPQPKKIYLDGIDVCKEIFNFSEERSVPERRIRYNELLPGEHIVEIVWPDGRILSKKFQIRPGKTEKVTLHLEDLHIISRKKVADKATYTYLMTDHKGKVWLLWDQSGINPVYMLTPKDTSNLFYATSTDGVVWSKPKIFSFSSVELDMHPILQQDSRGTYWLIWVSARNVDSPKWLWTCSSKDGLKWSFPHKINLPIDNKYDVQDWNKIRAPSFGFTIDGYDNFWLLWQKRLFRSTDGQAWVEVESVNIRGLDPEYGTPNHFFLTHDRFDTLLLFVKHHLYVKKDDSEKTRLNIGRALWQRKEQGSWINLASFPGGLICSGSICKNENGQYVAAYGGVSSRVYCRDKGWSEPIAIGGGNFPSIAPLGNGRYVVAYSDGGVFATVCEVLSDGERTHKDVQ